ncbi:zinc finger, CCHC-type [Artemisia annua]|uniref:Zinc finger, CCHC-type n=1 Tax=Artemisia annua TaxID=35608 RepID=A0A2U1KKD4_ARTAN|nr:zinc finger, CCHC-type [Artemisia annua]
MTSSSSLCSSFRTLTPHWNHNHSNKNLKFLLISHWTKTKHSFNVCTLTISSSFKNEPSSPKKPNKKQSQMSYDPSEDLFGVSADLQPSYLARNVYSRKALSSNSTPRSWFGPNGQYIRELPCPSCRGRGYTPCTMCGIERSRLDCSQCNGKGKVTCHQCSGECVIWEESIDERPWEKARSISPLKVKEDDEVDNLEIKLAARKKSKRVYKATSQESLNAKTGLFTNRMKIIHNDPELRAQRVAAIKKSKGSVDARKHASETMKAFFSDPENRLKRSISMKVLAKWEFGRVE